ncbi:Type I secretion system membrane fusion protein PrsE [Acaryochloris thomasi RCC1774]|uniref:Type I secretion system membrane fusion protein PrsE n=1 Tax=Acaryochloris thomasi RCC1774 TaxID=1764569 RepID=A0A2W1JZ62_9CYAN|nr:Type I secretion system membrane fusion protein PrsE [Acaryochloris thomasi RCC1774]
MIGQSASGDIDLNQLTVPVKSESLTLRIAASGTLIPAQNVNLSPKVAGVVAQLLVEQGDQVEQGQVIARMDRRDLEGQIIQARASVAQAQARLAELRAGNRVEEVAQAQARMSQAQAELARRRDRRPEAVAEASSQVAAAESMAKLSQKRVDRYQGLAEAGAETRDRVDEVIADNQNAQAMLREARMRLQRVQNETEREVQQSVASVQEAQQAFRLSQQGTRPEEIAQAVAATREAEGRLRIVENQFRDTDIRAPFAGIITQKFASVGAFVTPTTSASSTLSSTSASIVSLARELEVVAKVPEIDIGKVRPGQQVEIRADAYPEKTFTGRVRLVSPEAVVDQNVTSFEVRISLLSGQDQLLSGMNTDLTFLGDKVDDAVVVPTVAIATQKGQAGVYLPDEDDKPEFKPVTIGTSVADKTQILDGVEPGERVFIDFPEGVEPEDSEAE